MLAALHTAPPSPLRRLVLAVVTVVLVLVVVSVPAAAQLRGPAFGAARRPCSTPDGRLGSCVSTAEPGGCPAFPTLQTLLSARPTLCATDGPYIVICCPHVSRPAKPLLTLSPPLPLALLRGSSAAAVRPTAIVTQLVTPEPTRTPIPAKPNTRTSQSGSAKTGTPSKLLLPPPLVPLAAVREAAKANVRPERPSNESHALSVTQTPPTAVPTTVPQSEATQDNATETPETVQTLTGSTEETTKAEQAEKQVVPKSTQPATTTARSTQTKEKSRSPTKSQELPKEQRQTTTVSPKQTTEKPKVGKTTLEPTTTKPDESEKETSTKKSTEEREKTAKKPEVTTAKPEPKTTTLAPTTREPERTTNKSTPATKKTPPPPPPPPTTTTTTTTSSPARRPSFNSSPFLLAGGLFVTPPKHLEAPTQAPLVDLPPVPALSALPAARLAGAEECGRPSAPWVALVGSRRHWLCAGALLGPRLVLTAARCVDGREPEDLVVRLGEGGDTVMSGVLRAVIHPLHSGGRHDLALLLLAGGPADGGVCLATGRPTPELRTLGRGVSPFGTSGPVGPLLSTTMSEVRSSDCDAAYRVLPTYRREFPLGISGTEVCVAAAGPDTAERRCPQDRGGPLVTTGRGGRLQLVGLMREAAGCGTTVFPNVYTRLSEYSTWIGRTAAELAA